MHQQSEEITCIVLFKKYFPAAPSSIPEKLKSSLDNSIIMIPFYPGLPCTVQLFPIAYR
jgi:hypothetical protein